MFIYLQETEDEEAELWVEEIQSSIETANRDAETGLKSNELLKLMIT